MCAVSENILNLKEIYSNRSHYHQWVNNLAEVFLPGFGDSSVLKGTDLLPELPAMALSAVNFDSGFSETVMTIEGETGVAVMCCMIMTGLEPRLKSTATTNS